MSEWAKELLDELAEEIAGMSCCLPVGDIQAVFERRRLLGLLEAGQAAVECLREQEGHPGGPDCRYCAPVTAWDAAMKVQP